MSRLVALNVRGRAVLALRNIYGLSERQIAAIKQDMIQSIARRRGISDSRAAALLDFTIEGQNDKTTAAGPR